MKLRHLTKRIFTAALTVWLSGVVLFVCCQMPTADTANAQPDSCPLAKKNNCKKLVHGNFDAAFESEPKILDCCVFPANVFDKARKIEVQPTAVVNSTALVNVAPKIFSVKKSFKATRAYQSFARNSSSLHLQNCVFRI